jgi:hypothetical protein
MLNVERPGDEFPPSRPGPRTFLAVVVVIIAGFAIAYWPEILGTMGVHIAPPAAAAH